MQKNSEHLMSNNASPQSANSGKYVNIYVCLYNQGL